jgi:GntR family transcriptional regulator/MocR family aminotransferase
MQAGDPSDLMLLGIDRASPVPVLRQLYFGIRQSILDGRLPPGARLPPSRALAQRLGLARNTVVAAYEQLIAEGFAEGRIGAGTEVSRTLPQAVEAPPRRVATPDGPVPGDGPHGTAPFTTGRVDWDARSRKVWRGLVLRHLDAVDDGMLGYGDPRGSHALRAAVAAYLRAARAVRCEADQVVVTAGAQQAIDLVLRAVLRPGDAVWMEDPGYPAVRAAMVAAGAAVASVPVDAQGLDVAAGLVAAPQARLAYVTPSSQYPLGVVLSMARRLELLAWARRAGAWVLEDDYDSEFRYAGRPLAALQGIDEAGRVIYVGSFSKVLFPGLRLGYAVLPPGLRDAVLAARLRSDWHPPTLAEGVVADFLAEGHFAQHLRRMRLNYRTARDALAAALRDRLGDVVEVAVPEQGLKLLARPKDGRSDLAMVAAAARRGLTLRAVSPMYRATTPRSALMLGFSGHRPGALRWAVEELALALRS